MPRGTRACGSGCWRPFGGCPTGPTPPLPAGGPLLSGGGGGYRGGAAPGRGDGGRVSCHGGGLPDSGLLEQVGAHLEERREIAVDVQVKAGGKDGGCVSSGGGPAGADFNTVRQAVESAVRAGLTGGSWGRVSCGPSWGADLRGGGRGELRPHRPGGRCGGSGGRAATTGHTDGSGTGGTA